MVAILVTLGAWNALRINDRGLWCKMPVLTAWFITLFKWPIIFPVVSKLPLAAKGFNASIASGANILSSGLWPNFGNTWFSNLRHKLLAVFSAMVVFLMANQSVATLLKVLLAESSCSRCLSSLNSLGSIFGANSSLAATRFFLASASETSG